MTFLPQLERDLFNAAEERLGAGAAYRPRQVAAGVPLILSAAVVIAVVIVALGVRHHGHHPVQRTTPSASAAGSARAELIRNFGVLRRPQTTSDLDLELLSLWLHVGPQGTIPPERFIPLSGPAALVKRSGRPELDRALIRVVKLPALEGKVLIAPATFQPSPSSPRRSEGLNLALWIGHESRIPPSSFGGTGPRPVSVGTVLAHGLAFTDPATGANRLDGVVLVPDGVASVELGPFAISPQQTPPGVSTQALNSALAAINETATVRENVAAFRVAMPVVATRSTRFPAPSSRGYAFFGIGTKVLETWLDTSGQVVKRTTGDVGLVVRVRVKRAP